MAKIISFFGECESCGAQTKSRKETLCHSCKSVHELDPSDIGMASAFFEQNIEADVLDPSGKIFEEAEAVNVTNRVLLGEGKRDDSDESN